LRQQNRIAAMSSPARRDWRLGASLGRMTPSATHAHILLHENGIVIGRQLLSLKTRTVLSARR